MLFGVVSANKSAMLVVAKLLPKKLLAAFAAGYHEDAEQDENS